jgi:two-component system sensor histidine kinase ChvG
MDGNNRNALSNIVHSFSFRLALLAIILLSVPLILYRQFAQAEREEERLLTNAIDQTNRVTAALLAPHLEKFSSEPPNALRDAMARAAGKHMRIRVLVRLQHSRPDDFVYVASMPSFPEDYLKRERSELLRSGILQRLGPACDQTANLGIRFMNSSGTQEVLTAMTPLHINGNCWIVIGSENASDLAQWPISHSFWKMPELRTAVVIYLISTALLAWLFFHMWRNVRRFRRAARRIRLHEKGTVSFRELNTIPELTHVAEDFDALVNTLVASQSRIREAAEENSHALKGPLAVISQSIEPIKHAVSPTDAATNRSIQLIERAVARLDAMVTIYRDLENAAADLIFPTRVPLDLSTLLKTTLPAYEQILSGQGKRLISQVQDGVIAWGNDELLEHVIENLLENAASFTSEYGAVEVQLAPESNRACLRIMDRGPGVAPNLLPKIFERSASFRTDAHHINGSHQGLGLWIVRRNIEALGGTVHASNRSGRGLEVIVRLQLAG